MEVADDEGLLRRVHPAHIATDGRVMWVAFRGPELSVDRERLRPLPDQRRPFPHHSFARFRAGAYRVGGFGVVADPVDGNGAHALILSSPRSHGETRRLAMALRDLAEWPVA